MGGGQPVGGGTLRARKKGLGLLRMARAGCLVVIIGLCVSVGAVVMALQSGPLQITMPGGGLVKIGSDDFVMSNYSFQNGTTYYLDLDGNGVRNIVQLHYMAESRKLEMVLHHATKDVMRDSNLFTVPIP